MLFRVFWIPIFFLFFNSLSSQEPISIVIIGGGPAGLATAIEAKSAGADVIIVEKREQYTRKQFVILYEPAINFLDKWKVSVPHLFLEQKLGKKIGVVEIKDLEIGLAQRVNELGILKIQGKFEEIKDGKVIISHQNHTSELSYDLLVGADGTHSAVRNNLNIATTLYGYSLASTAFIPHQSSKLELILPRKCSSIFINKLIIPQGVIICAQGNHLSKEILAAATQQMGWLEESLSISSSIASYFDKIEIRLQQAISFSDKNTSAILLGDAAASASFLQGTGANYALETATIAGLFFKTKQQDNDYTSFDYAMQEATDRLISDSIYLFK